MKTLVFLLLTCNLWAQPQWGSALRAEPSNIVQVAGTGEIEVVPDLAVLPLAVETRDRVLAAAKDQNDKVLRGVVAALGRLQIDPVDIQTGYIGVDINYAKDLQTIVDHYKVTRSIMVTLKDVSKFDAVLAAVLEAGVNHVYEIEFKTTKVRAYRDQARAMAVKAAIEKANDLAAACGLKVVGKPVGVSLDQSGGVASSWRGPEANAQVNAFAAGDGTATETTPVGKISISSTVTLSFRFE